MHPSARWRQLAPWFDGNYLGQDDTTINCRTALTLGSGDGPLSVRRHPSTVNGASRFLRKWPSATIDRGASVPPPDKDQGPGRSLPGSNAGHPLQGAGAHGATVHDPEYARNDLGRRGDE
jgi:hypothetical protein